ncbi:dienelactone hydrolase family protein [Marinomonas mediterranea]|uniref:dienelactone hydrolase family protein n=1 Tax=Marinomonas mediterranea TaxID=119864 RepID=UPI00234AF794|nr:dienelactone hydrolase family protein [Marinomonas mediterranea]WCN10650.1 dienelactone hydrolase family protein [Marinomonas mediterranea]
MIIQRHNKTLSTPTGGMQVTVYRPVDEGAYPAIIFYSEIFQQTTPIARSAKILAGHGFVVLVPEIFHEFNPEGTVLAYDDEGKDKGNADKFAKPLESYDSDNQVMIDYLKSQPFCSGKVGSMGVCIGGHLAFRAALNPSVDGAFCLYATDLHSNTLPCNEGNQTLERCGDIQCEMVMVFGKQDPHVSPEGRRLIHNTMSDNQVNFSWLEVNAQHAFMRDEGDRYDAALALQMYRNAVDFFHRCL